MLFVPLHSQTAARWHSGSSSFGTALGIGLRLGDLLVLAGGALLAHRLRFGTAGLPLEYLRMLVPGLAFAVLVFNASGLYRSWRGRALASEVAQLGLQWTLLFALMALYMAALHLTLEVSRTWLLAWYLVSLAGAAALRLGARGAAAWVRARGVDLRSAVVVGATPGAQRIVDSLAAHPWAGIAMRGWFATGADRGDLAGLPRLGELDALGEYVEHHAVDQVWIALPLGEQAKIARTLAQLRHATADVKFVPDLLDMHLLNHSVEQVVGLPVITLQQTPLQGAARLAKDLEDRLLAAAIVLAISPLMLAIAVAVKLSSPGPVFYRQERISWNNRPFQMLKFRSMPVDAEQATGAVWARSGENRATRVGAFLRRTSLDELPQFLNVLKGEMSIVGPRPERPVFVHQFKHAIPDYMKKHMVKAGITGWAQVNGWRGSTDLGKRIECDIHYIQNWSLWFDLKIIALTLFKGFVHKNAY